MAENTNSKPLHQFFTAVPPHYDLINSIVTWGLDHGWRDAAARTCLSFKPKKFLDLGCGTGDLAITVARMAKNNPEVTGLDYSQPMLEIAREKAKSVAGDSIKFTHGDASEVPFPSGHFDCIGISFAFRNMIFRNPLSPRILSEVLRVLQPGGRFVAVESSQPKSRIMRWLFHLYMRGFVANVGYLFSGNKGAYKYLGESAARFYTPEEVKEILIKTGFREVTYRPLLFGAAGIHVATK